MHQCHHSTNFSRNQFLNSRNDLSIAPDWFPKVWSKLSSPTPGRARIISQSKSANAGARIALKDSVADVRQQAAFALGQVLGGSGSAWSAEIAIVIVTANFVANALSVAWAAHISPMILYAVAMGGFLVRLVVFTIALVLLNTLAWFSPVAFALTLVPATIGLLVVEARTLSGRLQADMWSFQGTGR